MTGSNEVMRINSAWTQRADIATLMLLALGLRDLRGVKANCMFTLSFVCRRNAKTLCSCIAICREQAQKVRHARRGLVCDPDSFRIPHIRCVTVTPRQSSGVAEATIWKALATTTKH